MSTFIMPFFQTFNPIAAEVFTSWQVFLLQSPTLLLKYLSSNSLLSASQTQVACILSVLGIT